jgi:hypothetical protein
MRGPGRWRSAIVNPAPGVHRTTLLYQFIKEKFVLTVSLKSMRFYFSSLLVMLTPHMAFRVCVVPKAFLKLLRYVSAPGPLSRRRKGTGHPGIGFRETCSFFAGVQGHVAA